MITSKTNWKNSDTQPASSKAHARFSDAPRYPITNSAKRCVAGGSCYGGGQN